MSSDTRAALEHENWISYLTGVAGCTRNAGVTRAGGVVSILTGLPFDWFSQILVEHEDADPAALKAAVARARGRGDPFVVRLRAAIDDRFVPVLAAAGFAATESDSWTPGMVAFPIDPVVVGAAAAPGLEIHRVTDATGIDVHRSVVTSGFGSPPDVAAGTVCLALLDRPGCVVYVGYADTVPVVSGLGWPTGSTIGVYSIATIPTARGRGYGAAMTARVVSDGLAAGCTAAALQASEMGRPIYERLGFRTVVGYVAYGEA